MSITGVESVIRFIGVLLGMLTLAVALWQGVWRGLQRNTESSATQGSRLLRAPYLLVFGLLWVGVCVILWHPLPVRLLPFTNWFFLFIGMLFYVCGQAVYLWGAATLGGMYRPSSVLGGVRFVAGDRLITYGPFAYVRHPLYLGLQIAALGGLLIYRNWTFVFIAVNFMALFFRARREEQALAGRFGEEWERYASQVPAWLPRFWHRVNER